MNTSITELLTLMERPVLKPVTDDDLMPVIIERNSVSRIGPSKLSARQPS